MPDKDDPFFDMDDERTIIKPNPGGRRRQAPRRQERRRDPDQKIELSERPGLNKLEKSAAVLLNLLSQIRNTSSHPNPTDLHKQLANEIQRFEAKAQHEGLVPETIFIARYALCTTIDEFVMSTPWGSSSIWNKQSLLSMFHKETHGGERFFQMLTKLSQDPARNIDLLELLYLCLALGFQGRYRVSQNGMNELAEIRESLYHTIRHQHEEPEPALSPHWEGLNKSAIAKAALIPGWLATSARIWFSSSLPASPISLKPAATMIEPRIPASPHSLTSPGTEGPGVQMMAKSGVFGRAATFGKAWIP